MVLGEWCCWEKKTNEERRPSAFCPKKARLPSYTAAVCPRAVVVAKSQIVLCFVFLLTHRRRRPANLPSPLSPKGWCFELIFLNSGGSKMGVKGLGSARRGVARSVPSARSVGVKNTRKPKTARPGSRKYCRLSLSRPVCAERRRPHLRAPHSCYSRQVVLCLSLQQKNTTKRQKRRAVCLP